VPDTACSSWLRQTCWQDMAELISQAGGASGKTHLRKGRMTHREEEGKNCEKKWREHQGGKSRRSRRCSRYQSRYPLQPTEVFLEHKKDTRRSSREKLLCTDQNTPAMCCLQQGTGGWSKSVKRREGKMVFLMSFYFPLSELVIKFLFFL